MSGRRRLREDALTWGLSLLAVFLFVALVGFDPADLAGASAAPAADPVRNPCGPAGARAAHALVQTLGGASFLVSFCLILYIFTRFRGISLEFPGRSLGGLALLLVTTAGFLQRFGPSTIRGPVIGLGGYVGAFGSEFVEAQFGPAGMLLIFSSAGIGGAILARELLLIIPAREVRALLARGKAAEAPDTIPLGLPNPAGSVGVSVAPPAVRAIGEPVPSREVAPTLGFRRDPGEALPPVRSLAPQPKREASHAALPPVHDGTYEFPSIGLLENAPPFPMNEHGAKLQSRALLLEKTLLEFGCQVRVVQIDTGPVITQFEIELEAGLRVAKINSVANDLAIALAVPSVRIVSPIPGKTTVGIEVPNDRRTMVRLRDVIEGIAEKLGKFRIPLFLGKDVKGMPLAFDLADMPHLLIAGRTGTGKSVCLNAMILSILMTKRPDEVKLILIDPKMVELSQFKRVPHLMHPVVTDMKKAEALLSWACDKMDERYGFLARAGVRNIQTYNSLGAEQIYERLRPEDDEERARIPTYMPYIVIIADEMADLMMTAPKEVESHIVRLAQKARAVGMHLIVATQKPTVDVITGLIKGNLPARIAFQVSSRGDSRVVLDEMGADKLLGNGDMLFLIPGTSHIVRAQGTYVSDGEVNGICEYLQRYPVEYSKELVQMQVAGGPGGKERGAALKERDELYEPAIEIVIREGRGSCSLLQRALGIGYGRASRLIDFMAEDGIVGEYKAGGPREVLYSWEEWESLKNGGDAQSDAA